MAGAGIERVAVVGAGVMGAGIAAHVASAGLPVLLLDVAPEGSGGEDRDRIAREGLERVRRADPAGFMHPRDAERVAIGNLDDDLPRVADVDWVIEAIVERLDVKRSLYERLAAVKRPATIVSSNTSTIPLARLAAGLPEAFRRRFLITHFFNPPRYMRLLELVAGEADRQVVATVRRICDARLGKGVVEAKDTPGFIANRIGTLWLGTAVAEAVAAGISVEAADAVLGSPFGIPRTGAFGLIDLIGLDLLPHMRASMGALLPPDDPFQAIPEPPPYLARLIAEGYTGRKGKGGFYRRRREGGERVREALDLATGTYRPERRPELAGVAAAGAGGLRALLEHDEPAARYAWRVMARTLLYAARLVPEIADDIVAVDTAMRLGYRWERGPFELIDALGPEWFAARAEADGEPIPPLLEAARGEGFYRERGGKVHFLRTDHAFEAVRRPDGSVRLADIKRAGPRVAGNRSASLWDVGEGVLCLEFHTRMNALDQGVIDTIGQAGELVSRGRTGLVIYNEAEDFSLGANAGLILFASHLALWEMVEAGLEAGQQAYRGLKYGPFPVVGAPAGRALGGGCEILLHCDAVQAHAETYMGLVEAGVGLVPGWGGCTEILTRWMRSPDRPGGPMPGIRRAFELVSLATVSRSAAEARDHLLLREHDRITMNRDRLLADARARVLELADGYAPPAPAELRLPGPSAKVALALAVEGFRLSGAATAHDAVVAGRLADVMSGGATDITEPVSEEALLALEREAFLALLRTDATAARLEHMLETGRPLRN